MEYDLNQFGREMTQRLEWLLGELNRLRDENQRLLRENKELREEVTLERLQDELKGEPDLPIEVVASKGVESVLSPEALEFYRGLPERIDFSDFFHRAEGTGVSGAQAREFMLSFFRSGLLAQRGRRLEKSSEERDVRAMQSA